MLVARNITFHYPGSLRPILNDLSFSAEAGQRLVVVGLNGSGKSTLAKLLGGLLPIQSGELTLRNIPISRLNGESRPISLLQRFDELFLATRVDREIAVNYELAGIPEGEIPAKVQLQADRHNVSHLLSRECHTLSPGERLRVALAAQLSRSTPLLVIDEADAFLDSTGRMQLQDVTKRLAESGSIVIRVTHDLASIEDDERLFVVHEGILREHSKGPRGPSTLFPVSHAAPSRRESLSSLANAVPFQGMYNSARGLKLNECEFSPADGMLVGPVTINLSGTDWTGLSGLNGSGKTLLGKFLAGLYCTKSGNYQINLTGKELKSAESILPDPKLIGYLPPEPERFLIAATVRECFKVTPELKKFHDWTNLLDFDVHLLSDRDPLSLSGGEQRRLAILIALQFDPAYLILDEPTVNVDIIGREKIAQLLKMWKTSGRGGLLISHDQELLQLHCNRLLTLG